MKLLVPDIRAVLVAFCTAILLVPSLSHAQVRKVDIEGIRNFSQLDGASGYAGPMVGFGGGTAPEALPLLKERGFETVINLRLAGEENVNLEGSIATAEAVGLNYIHLPFGPEGLTPELVGSFLEAVGIPANQPVYIHCNSATRVGALWMVARVQADKWEREAAGKEVEQIAGSPEESIAAATAYLDAH